MSTANNILLVNPWIFDFTAYDFWSRPLGLLYLAALLRDQTKARLHFIDCLDTRHPGLEDHIRHKEDGRSHFPKAEVEKPEVLREIPRKFSRYGIPIPVFDKVLQRLPRPDVVLITSSMTYWYPGVQLAVERVRKLWGSVPIILGGTYATLLPLHAKAHSGADVVYEGPGEFRIFSVLREVLGDSFCADLSFTSLQDLPLPAYEMLHSTDTLAAMTSRGCPFRCEYCASLRLCPHFEQLPPGVVVEQLIQMSQRFKVKNLAWYDDALLVNKKNHIIPVLEEIIRLQLPISFHTPNGLHVREIDQKLAFLLKRANFQSLYLSQESFEDDVLHASGKKVAAGDLERGLANLAKAGFELSRVRVYILAGLPGQDSSAVRKDLEKVLALGARPYLAYFSPVPGTVTWENLKKAGIMNNESDPMLQNKLVFPYLMSGRAAEEMQALKDLTLPPVAES